MTSVANGLLYNFTNKRFGMWFWNFSIVIHETPLKHKFPS